MLKVETDPLSGFCGGVIRAISKAEEVLSQGGELYSLGAIVHNEEELSRLRGKGLHTASSIADIPQGAKVLIRAHGEPPKTYLDAAGREIIDCTCPVVLNLQKSIRETYRKLEGRGTILIFGRVGHAEVLGLMGQVKGDAIVVENRKMLEDALKEGRLDLSKPVEIFSQTTKSPSEYKELCQALRDMGANLTVHDTICAQVASRHRQLGDFAARHDAIVFVSGKESSNGKVLSRVCLSANPRTHIVEKPSDIRPEWFTDGESVGVCGATSTPKWLLEEVAKSLESEL